MSLTYKMAMDALKEDKVEAIRAEYNRKIKVCVSKDWVELGDGFLPWIYSTCDFQENERIIVGKSSYIVKYLYYDYKTRVEGKKDRGVVVYEVQELPWFKVGDVIKGKSRRDTETLIVLEINGNEDENYYRVQREDGSEGYFRIERQEFFKKVKKSK